MPGPRLARSAAEIGRAYDAVVVGSGYGGGIAASRMARMGLKVAVLERGREVLPGEFPRTLRAAQKAMQVSGRLGRVGSPEALFDLRTGEDVHVLVGCGLGGTSLINANVCLVPESRVLADEHWPEALRCDHYLQVGFGRARRMLAPAPLPETSSPLKLRALERSAQALGTEISRVPLHIAFNEGRNAAGVLQAACTQCGDCMGGCNVGAKTTVHNTYLADAANHGAELFTEAYVRVVEPFASGSGWRVLYQATADRTRAAPVRAVEAAIVVLAAGTLGSTEVLLRSRERGLALSDRLGRHVSTNADVIAFASNNDIAVNGVGVGHPARRGVDPPGPAVAGLIDLRRRKTLANGVAIVEAAIQSALAPVLPLLFAADTLVGSDTDRGLEDALAESGRKLESLLAGAYAGQVHNTQTFLAVGHDAAAGELRLEADRAALSWPGAAWDPTYQRIAETLRKAVAATGGTYLPNPVSTRFLGGNLLTVHPLGGCAMGEDRATGVVDHKCRVFDGDPAKPGTEVHEGLYVCDGAVVPRSLGVHPLLTISAIAERAMLLLARDLDRNSGIEPKSDAPKRDFRITKVNSEIAQPVGTFARWLDWGR